MSVTGQLTQVSQLLVQQAKYIPSVIELFWDIASLVHENPGTPRIKNLEGLSAERIKILREILPDPECAMERWTLHDFSELEFWKTQYPNDYEKTKSNINEIIEATRINRGLWLNRAWDILNYIFTGHSSDAELPLLVYEGESIPQINLFWGGNTIIDKDGFGTHYLEATEVREVAEVLSKISQQEIRQRFEQGLITQPDIYHFSWREQNYEWLFEMCISVKEFYADAASQGNAMLINID
ncbi:DUF1877 family protein [Leptolyngbya sp. FACHB-36]|uniref:DUF1877 family protein n=1 Tax=Leptolyngbya sp. FACHB-36 TaxID=2692808 RepID=UPI00167FFF93|nr:DUF1877 family protein [Leptolyngbya sp. FACHB-36]MBD2021268.1 DUF1877 family protein [Leptolyngbya sp. FACHB-36]